MRKRLNTMLTENIKNCINKKRIVQLDPIDIEILFMLSCAKVTNKHWNEPGYTFILLGNEENIFQTLDNFELASYLPGATTTLEFFPKYVSLFERHQEMINVEFLMADEDSENEFVYEATIIVDEMVLHQLEDFVTQKCIQDSLAQAQTTDTFQQEIVQFIQIANQ